VTPPIRAVGAGRPRDATERQRAVTRLLRPRLEVPPGVDGPTLRRLARLDDVVAEALGSGDHDELLDDRGAGVWPAALARLRDDVLRRLPAAPDTGHDQETGTDPDPARDPVERALTTRFGFGPLTRPESPLLVASGRAGEASAALERRGWSRIALAPHDPSIVEFRSAARRARAVVTDHLRRLHLELLPRYGAPGSPGSTLAVLSAAGTLVVVDAGDHALDPDDVAAFTDALVAIAAVETLRARDANDSRMNDLH
jgi:hypothetical protein